MSNSLRARERRSRRSRWNKTQRKKKSDETWVMRQGKFKKTIAVRNKEKSLIRKLMGQKENQVMDP